MREHRHRLALPAMGARLLAQKRVQRASCTGRCRGVVRVRCALRACGPLGRHGQIHREQAHSGRPSASTAWESERPARSVVGSSRQLGVRSVRREPLSFDDACRGIGDRSGVRAIGGHPSNVASGTGSSASVAETETGSLERRTGREVWGSGEGGDAEGDATVRG